MAKSVKEILIEILKRQAVKEAIKQLAFNSGIVSFAVSYIMKEIFDDYISPQVRLAFRKAGLEIDKYKGQLVLKKLTEAEQNGDLGGITDAIDDIYKL